MMNILERIIKQRDLRGWTDYKLAKEAHLSQSTLTNLYKRNNAPILPTLEAICGAFGITLSRFFADGEEPVALTAGQRDLLNKWDLLTPNQKEKALAFITGCLEQ